MCVGLVHPEDQQRTDECFLLSRRQQSRADLQRRLSAHLRLVRRRRPQTLVTSTKLSSRFLCTVYSSRTEFGTSPKSAVTLIFCPQRIHKNYFKLCETYQNDTFEGMWVGFGNCSYVKVSRVIHHSKI